MSPQEPMLALVAAVADNGVIGKDGGMPWHVPEDLRHFKERTLGHAIVMGRRTHESIGRALPRRHNIVVTRNPNYEAPGCTVCGGLEEAITLARREGDPMPCVIGGATLYSEAMPRATHLFLTRIEGSPEGDTYFPAIPEGLFEETERRPGQTPGVWFATYEKRG